MGEDVEGGICGENNNWWSSIDSTRSASVFIPPLITSSSPNCSVVAATNDAAGNCTTWQTTHDDFMDLKSSRSCGGFPDEQKPHKNDNNNNNNNESADGESGSILTDSTLQIMGYGLSSSTSLPNWDHHHSLFGCNERRAEKNNSMVVEEERGIDCSKEWIRSKSFSSASPSSPPPPMNQEFSRSIRRGLPIGSSSYVSPSTLIHSLYADPDPQSQSQAHHSLFTNLSTMSYSSSPNSFLKPSPMAKQQQQAPVGLHFSNNTPFWNASADALNDMRAGAFASSSPSPSSILFNKLIKSEESDTESAKKNVSEAAFKRARLETPSPLPTFKVRKEKLGDRVTALQQLVSPFGKTDTASVLHEAIEYIKFLHDQVSVLSTPYMKSGGPIHDQRQQGCDDRKECLSSSKEDLRSRGLCLVPISSTFPVATETTADFWTPSLSFAAAGASLLR